MTRRAAIVVVLAIIAVALVPWPVSAATRRVTQTLVFDAMSRVRFVDRPPAGPSRGDTELVTASLRDAAGRDVGTARTTCVFTKVIPNDVLERCTASGKTSEGALSFGGVGHLESMNPPWHVAGGTGAYKGADGKLVFEADIPADPHVPIAAGRLFSVAVFRLTTNHRLHIGVVPRPAANAIFIQHANSACRAAEQRAMRLPAFPFSNFDPFHPDPQVLPRVGRFFDQPARRRLPRALLARLKKLGQPAASRTAWQNVIEARGAVLSNETEQIRAALADNATAFVRTVYAQARDYNQLVFTSAVFGVQACVFS